MTEKTDYNARAAEFLKLWQDSITKQMTDPDAIRAMLTAMQSFGATPHDAHSRRHAASPHAGDDAVRHLTERVRQLELDLARLHRELRALAAKAKDSAGGRARSSAKPVAKPKRAGAKMVRKPKPATKRKPAKAKTKAKRKPAKRR